MNKLTLSIEKTQYNIFHTKNKHIPDECNNLDLEDQRVMRVNEAKYLGVTMDEKLSWNGHVTKLHQNLIKFANYPRQQTSVFNAFDHKTVIRP